MAMLHQMANPNDSKAGRAHSTFKDNLWLFSSYHRWFQWRGWREGDGWGLRVEYGFCLLIFFPLKLTQPTLICGGKSEVRKWWNVKGTYLEEGGEGEWEGEGWGGEGEEMGNQIPSRQQVLHNPEWVITSSFFLLVSFSLTLLVLQTPLE